MVWQETHAYLHAVMAAGECSERAHALTGAVIALNGADYSAWSWRWRCVQAAVSGRACGSQEAAAPLLEELRFTELYAEENAKNYQLWNHRRLVTAALAAMGERARLRGGAREDAFTAAVLLEDAKNYHAWAHRVWAVQHFGLQEREEAFTRELIGLDARNNSAWNARFAAITRQEAALPAQLAELAAAELRFAEEEVAKDAHNESVWAYARGIARAGGLQQALQDIARRAVEMHPDATHAASVLADFAEVAAAASEGEERAAAAARAHSLFAQCLAVDAIRAPYWTFRMRAGELAETAD